MDLILNGEERSIDLSECANLAELVAVAEQAEVAVEDEACVVVSVEVDGESLTPEELSALENRSLDGVQRVSIQRRPSVAVAHSVLEQGADYTVEIAGAIEQTVDHYRGGRSDLANGLLADVIDSLTVLTGITYSVSSILPEEAQILAKLQGEIFPWLQELLEGQTEKDPIRIADVLEYEVSPRVEDWGKVMRALIGGAGALETAGPESFSN